MGVQPVNYAVLSVRLPLRSYWLNGFKLAVASPMLRNLFSPRANIVLFWAIRDAVQQMLKSNSLQVNSCPLYQSCPGASWWWAYGCRLRPNVQVSLCQLAMLSLTSSMICLLL